MPIDLNARRARDPKDPEMEAVLKGLQGNILRGHGRDHTVNLFMRFKAPAGLIRQRLATLLAPIVKSAFEEEQIRRDGAQDKTLFASFFLSAGGYRALGFSDDQIRKALPEPAGGDGFRSNFFEGMKGHGDELEDSAPSTWDAPFKGRVDALLLLAHGDVAQLEKVAVSLSSELSGLAEVTPEAGGALRPDKTAGDHVPGFEHFGFADGISQPAFFVDQVSRHARQSWDPLEPLSLVLVQDRAAGAAEAYGSYYVFRKLEQNVRGFVDRELELAKELGLQPQDRTRVAAMVMGRFRNGTPLAVSPGETEALEDQDDFRFEDGWQKCPFHAHIRKMNPRGTLATRVARPEEVVERPRRIVRRGIPYGQRNKQPWEEQSREELPTQGVGLLFACFQSSIAHQFAFLQSMWSNRTDFPAGAGVDPVIGTPLAGDSNRWPLSWGGDTSKRADFGKFVTLKGGEFFFAPSLPFLKLLAPPGSTLA